MARISIPVLAAAGLLAAGPVAAGDKTDPRCSAYGERFIYSESTGFCVRVSGSVEAGFVAGSKGSPFGIKDSKGSHFGNEEQLNFDARKDTDMGPLRLYVAPKAGSLD